jgi:L-lactate dehydrogenase complex protein LldG
VSYRDELLARLRAQTLEPVPLPELAGDWITYPDREAQFGAALARAAGSVAVAAAGDVRRAVAELPVVQQAARFCSLVAAVPGNLTPPGDPRGYRDVDVLLCQAEFGVAENGAVWLDERAAPVRAGLFLTQHLVLLLERASLVDHMHEAYARLGARVGQTGYGCFLCGPSKTADIEQALVVGAHGARSLVVVLY